MEVIISKLLSVLIMVSALLGITVDMTEFEPIDDFNGGDPFIVETQTGTYYTYTTGEVL